MDFEVDILTIGVVDVCSSYTCCASIITPLLLHQNLGRQRYKTDRRTSAHSRSFNWLYRSLSEGTRSLLLLSSSFLIFYFSRLSDLFSRHVLSYDSPLSPSSVFSFLRTLVSINTGHFSALSTSSATFDVLWPVRTPTEEITRPLPPRSVTDIS